MSIKSIIQKIKPINYYFRGRKILNNSHYQSVQALNKKEVAKTPSRTDILNFLLSKRDGNATNYLEIGVRNPEDNFNHIAANEKYSVDPGVEYKLNPVDFKLTSDEFFQQLRAGKVLSSDIQFDVIFIDGLHLADQVERDIANALEFIKPDGWVLLHDCNPPTEWHARDNYEYFNTPAHGFWNGTTWKAFQKYRFKDSVQTCCINTDWGIGVVSKHHKIGKSIAPVNPYYEFHVMDKNRKQHLNLVSFDEFKKMVD